MIRKPNDWETVQAFDDRRKLPVGAYVCKIIQAVVRDSDYGEQLNIVFDISEGEYAGFYKASFDGSQREDKKWKGVLRQFLPKDDGSEKDGWTKSSLKGLITSIEESNPGYTWNWDERTLSGKSVGIIFRNVEWEYNGKTGWVTRPFRACSIDTVYDGSYNLPEDKPLKNAAAPTFYPVETSATAPAPVNDYALYGDDDGNLPF